MGSGQDSGSGVSAQVSLKVGDCPRCYCCDMDVSTRNLMVSWQPYNGVEYTLGLNIFPFPPCLLPRVCRRASTRTPASQSAARPLRSRRIPRARRQQGRSRVTTPL